MMKSLIWNCRGIRKTGVSSFLKDLILEHNFHLIGLQETIIADFDNKLLERFDPSKNYLWKWTPSRGRSGGILSGIRVDMLDVGSFVEGKYILQMNLWEKQLSRKWSFLNVYGAAQEEDKPEFLAEFGRFCSKINDPYLIWGDFNIIRYSYEKRKTLGCIDNLGCSMLL